jgi:hypothetical protein
VSGAKRHAARLVLLIAGFAGLRLASLDTPGFILLALDGWHGWKKISNTAYLMVKERAEYLHASVQSAVG